MPFHFRAVIIGCERGHLSVSDLWEAVLLCLLWASDEGKANYTQTFANVFINNIRL